jgi:hypothetical protein
MSAAEVVTAERAALAWADPEYRDSVLREVRDEGDGLALGSDDGWWIVAPKHPAAPTAPGTRLRCWGRGIGYSVRGIALGDVVLRYETVQEERARFDIELAEQRRRRIATATAERPASDARIAALPPVFRDRIAAYRAANPDFWWDLEGYELFVCEQAVAFAEALGTPDAVRDFHALPYDEQRRLVPAMSDDHSGNTFGAECFLARAYLTDPALVSRAPGSLAPLVGQAAYETVEASA